MSSFRVFLKYIRRLWSKFLEIFRRRFTQGNQVDDELDAALLLQLEAEFEQMEKDATSCFQPTGRMMDTFDIHSRIRTWHFSECGGYAVSAQRNGEDTKAAVYVFDMATEQTFEYGVFTMGFSPVILYWLKDLYLVVIGLTQRSDGYWLRQEIILLNHQTRNAEGFAPRLYSFYEMGTTRSFNNSSAQYGETITSLGKEYVSFCIEDEHNQIIVRYIPLDPRPAAPLKNTPLGFNLDMQYLRWEEKGREVTAMLNYTPTVWNNRLYFQRTMFQPNPGKHVINRHYCWDFKGMCITDINSNPMKTTWKEITATVAKEVNLSRVTLSSWRQIISKGNRFTFVKDDSKTGDIYDIFAYNIDRNMVQKLSFQVERDDVIGIHPSGALVHWFHEDDGKLCQRTIEEAITDNLYNRSNVNYSI